MTKHIIVQDDCKERFAESLDKASEDNKVFATQTHVTNISGRMWYTAVCFVREDK